MNATRLVSNIGLILPNDQILKWDLSLDLPIDIRIYCLSYMGEWGEIYHNPQFQPYLDVSM